MTPTGGPALGSNSSGGSDGPVAGPVGAGGVWPADGVAGCGSECGTRGCGMFGPPWASGGGAESSWPLGAVAGAGGEQVAEDRQRTPAALLRGVGQGLDPCPGRGRSRGRGSRWGGRRRAGGRRRWDGRRRWGGCRDRRGRWSRRWRSRCRLRHRMRRGGGQPTVDPGLRDRPWDLRNVRAEPVGRRHAGARRHRSVPRRRHVARARILAPARADAWAGRLWRGVRDPVAGRWRAATGRSGRFRPGLRWRGRRGRHRLGGRFRHWDGGRGGDHRGWSSGAVPAFAGGSKSEGRRPAGGPSPGVLLGVRLGSGGGGRKRSGGRGLGPEASGDACGLVGGGGAVPATGGGDQGPVAAGAAPPGGPGGSGGGASGLTGLAEDWAPLGVAPPPVGPNPPSAGPPKEPGGGGAPGRAGASEESGGAPTPERVPRLSAPRRAARWGPVAAIHTGRCCPEPERPAGQRPWTRSLAGPRTSSRLLYLCVRPNRGFPAPQ